MKKQSFVTGAIILMIANAISKILGAVFKIPLTYILKEEGMAIYNSAFQIYALFLSFVISGIPFAIAKLVSEYGATGENKKIKAVIKTSTFLLLGMGLVGSILLYFGAEFFAVAMKEERAAFAIRMLSPSVLMVALSCIYKNYFQGKGNMIPTAVSQVIESVIKLMAGYMLATMLIRFGTLVAAGGAALGVSIGEVIATIVLYVSYKLCSRDMNRIKADNTEIPDKIAAIAFPVLIASVLSSMLSVIDTSLLRKRLIDFGNSIEEARFLYGAYTGYALTVFHLPVGIMATFGVSILPVIAGSLASGKAERAKKAAITAIKLNIILSLPCAVGIYFLGETVLYALFRNTSSAMMLAMTAPCVVFLCVSQIAGSILNSAGKIMLSFWLGALSIVLKIILAYILVGRYSIYGTIISANIAYFVDMILSLWAAKRIIGLKYDIMEIIIKPVCAAAVMVLVLYMVKVPFEAMFNNIYVRLVVSALLSGTVYLFSLFIFGGISIREMKKAVAK